LTTIRDSLYLRAKGHEVSWSNLSKSVRLWPSKNNLGCSLYAILSICYWIVISEVGAESMERVLIRISILIAHQKVVLIVLKL